MQSFMFVGVSVIEILELNWKRRSRRRTWQLCENLNYKHYTRFTYFLDFFADILSFQQVLHFCVGISQTEWKLKVKTESEN